jgi:hypothetical protein
MRNPSQSLVSSSMDTNDGGIEKAMRSELLYVRKELACEWLRQVLGNGNQ